MPFVHRVRLTDAAVEAGAAVELRIDDDAIAAAQRAGAGVDDFARHLVSHDPRIADGNGAVEDLVVGAADPAVRHPHEHLAGRRPRPRHLVADQLPGAVSTMAFMVEVRSAK